MTTQVKIKNGVITRHDRVDHAAGEKLRRQHRDMVDLGKKRDGNNPFNEAFSFSIEEYSVLSKINPALKDPEPPQTGKGVSCTAETAGRLTGKALEPKLDFHFLRTHTLIFDKFASSATFAALTPNVRTEVRRS